MGWHKDYLIPFLFNIVIDEIIQKIRQGYRMGVKTRIEMLKMFFNDIRTYLIQEAKKHIMSISAEKTNEWQYPNIYDVVKSRLTEE